MRPTYTCAIISVIISDERVVKPSENYKNAQIMLEARVSELRNLVVRKQEAKVNVDDAEA